MFVRSDIEIAQAATLKPIAQIAARLGIPEDALDAYGRHKAKISLEYIDGLKSRPNGKLILVSAISPRRPARARRRPPSASATRSTASASGP
jgi:formyltetrahydrofolate synthetase